MDNNEIFGYIDHTLLKPFCTFDEICTLCDEAVKYKTASVCIPPCFVKAVREKYKTLNICTVIGFPNGYNTSEVKALEAVDAIKNGANEIDTVINIGDVKSGHFERVFAELTALRTVTKDCILKVIIETCYLTEAEKIKMCEIVTESGADFIKTSTGFGTGGATIEDIELFKKHIGENVKMKAAGGVKSKADLEMFINAGCARIGTSSAIKILTAGETNGGY